MPRIRGTTILAVCVLLGGPGVGEIAAQSPKPVCPLLSVEEVRKVTGRQDYGAPWEVGPGEGIGGGSACVFGSTTGRSGEPPMIGFTLIQGKNWTQGRRTVKLLPGCKQESVKGVGDDAFFESCPNGPSRRSDPLYIKVGSNDLIVEMGVTEPATKSSVRPTIIAFAKTVAAKVR